MATPLYDAFCAKIRDWANKRDAATVPDDVIADCFRYGLDDIQRDLRVPPLEYDQIITVTSEHNLTPGYSRFIIPEDMIEFIWLAKLNEDDGSVEFTYDNLPDIRTFLNPYAENYERHRYAWSGLDFLVAPQLEVGQKIQLHYYRRLPKPDALYSVVPENYSFDYPDASQPMLELGGSTPLYKVTGGDVDAIFSTSDEADEYILTNGGAKTSVLFDGKEAWNWLRDNNEKLVLWAALMHIGSYLDFTEMEARYQTRLDREISKQNAEERFRRAKGGNIQVNVNTGGLL